MRSGIALIAIALVLFLVFFIFFGVLFFGLDRLFYTLISGYWDFFLVWGSMILGLGIILPVIMLRSGIRKYKAGTILEKERQALESKLTRERRELELETVQAQRESVARDGASLQTPVTKEREVIQKEIVKVRCRYCGKLFVETLSNCPYCSAPS